MKLLKVSEAIINKKIEELRQCIIKANGVGSFSINLQQSTKLSANKRIDLEFTKKAWTKMQGLIDQCEKEVGWHGTVVRTKYGFKVIDVLVFPQEVTGATVDADEVGYCTWLSALPNETFNMLRFHGHSHVRMGVSPSATDTSFQANVVKDLEDFYIFAIFNKQGANWINIVDVENNTLYEDDDIVLVTPDSADLTWASNQLQEKVKEKKYTYTPPAQDTRPIYGYTPGQYHQGTFIPGTAKDTKAKPDKKDKKKDKEDKSAYTQMHKEMYPGLYGKGLTDKQVNEAIEMEMKYYNHMYTEEDLR